jgi:hypothetical protein
VNVVFAVFALIGAALYLPRHEKSVDSKALDWKGTILVTAGLFFLVYGFSSSESNGWADAMTVSFLTLGVVLLGLFTWVQTKVAHPLLPLRILTDRMRGTSYLVLLISAIGMFGIFLFLTYYLQSTLGYTPIETGLAFLPMVGALAITAGVCGSVLSARVSPKILVSAGLVLAALGMVLLTTIAVDSAYVTGILPGLLVVGVGLGAVFSNAMGLTTLGVDADDAGVASATVNTAQQVGGSIGVALLSSVAASAAGNYVADNTPTAAQVAAAGGPNAAAQQLADGATMASYHTAFWWAAAFFAVAAVLAAVLYRNEIPAVDPDAVPVLAH